MCRKKSLQSGGCVSLSCLDNERHTPNADLKRALLDLRQSRKIAGTRAAPLRVLFLVVLGADKARSAFCWNGDPGLRNLSAADIETFAVTSCLFRIRRPGVEGGEVGDA